MVVTSAVIGSAAAVADLLPVVVMAVIWAVVLAAAGVLIVLSVDDSVDVCSFAASSVVPVVVSATVLLPAVEVEDEVVELLDVRRDRASGRCEEPAPEAVDDATVRLADDVPAVSSAAAEDGAVDLGPRAVWPVVFFDDPELEEPEFDVAEFAEPDEELWSVSSALATATTGPARDNPSTKAAIPALAPR